MEAEVGFVVVTRHLERNLVPVRLQEFKEFLLVLIFLPVWVGVMLEACSLVYVAIEDELVPRNMAFLELSFKPRELLLATCLEVSIISIPVVVEVEGVEGEDCEFRGDVDAIPASLMHRLFNLRKVREFPVSSVVVEELINQEVVVILLEWTYLWLIVELRIIVANCWKNHCVWEVSFEFFTHFFDGFLQFAVHKRLGSGIIVFLRVHRNTMSSPITGQNDDIDIRVL